MKKQSIACVWVTTLGVAASFLVTAPANAGDVALTRPGVAAASFATFAAPGGLGLSPLGSTTGPDSESTTISASTFSPKVGLSTPPAQELIDSWASEVKRKSKAETTKKGKKDAKLTGRSTLTRAQSVSLTAWMLGDWASFDGDYENGKLPEEYLKELLTVPGFSLRHDASIMFDLMTVDFLEEFGRPIGITGTYRTFEAQVSLKAQKPFLAAPAGTSNHGWGLAVDLNGPEASFGTVERQWLLDNGWKYGWFSPTWAQATGYKPEPWHFEYMGTTEIAWPKSEKLLQRIDELNGDPLQGLFVED